jgi:hypothetical protein
VHNVALQRSWQKSAVVFQVIEKTRAASPPRRRNLADRGNVKIASDFHNHFNRLVT